MAVGKKDYLKRECYFRVKYLKLERKMNISYVKRERKYV